MVNPLDDRPGATVDSLIGQLELQQQRFSHELHDALLPQLFAARMLAERLRDECDDAARKSDLSTLVDYLAAAATEGRRLIIESHPLELRDGTWHDALVHYVDRGLPQHAVCIELSLANSTADVSPDMAVALYRIAQEAIRNAIRHAQATNIRVIAAGNATDGMTLTIEDDGCGFSRDQVDSNRFGLRNIHSRAAAVGAAVTIESAADKGATIQVRV